MTSVHFDSDDDDACRRRNLYRGDIYVYEPTSETKEFCEFVRDLLQTHFSGRDPELAQFDMAVDDYADLLGRLKPEFIHHPESKRHLQRIIARRGCDAGGTYFEVPKLRTSTSDGYLTSGIAYAWHPHRDTWYSAPQCQINWWMPVYSVSSANCMSFYPRYWSEPVANSSSGYNYYEWNSKYRGHSVTKMTKVDSRPLPRPTEPLELEPDLRIVCPVGGLILFSAAHLHASVPNTSGRTRISVDFRTVNLTDLRSGEGAANLDSACTGTALGEFRRASDLAPLDEDDLQRFEDGSERLGPRTFGAADAS
jgi:hypothetical protein